MTEKSSTEAGFKKKRLRSPPYPYLSLDKAIERARQMHRQADKHQVPLSVLSSVWGYGTKSGGLGQTAAALKHFGLLVDEGSGEKRKFRLTDDAIRIISDPDPTSKKRQDAIKTAALSPKIHLELWDKYGVTGASGSMDIALKSYLTLDRKDEGATAFTARAAEELIEEYKETIEYSGLSNMDIIANFNGESQDKERDDTLFGGANVGDAIQWEQNGVLKLEKPRRVRAITVEDEREWVFVEDSETGIPMEEVLVQKPDSSSIGKSPPPKLELPEREQSSQWKEVTNLDEGSVVLTLPETLSPESFEDLQIWMNMILRKAKRRSGS